MKILMKPKMITFFHQFSMWIFVSTSKRKKNGQVNFHIPNLTFDYWDLSHHRDINQLLVESTKFWSSFLFVSALQPSRAIRIAIETAIAQKSFPLILAMQSTIPIKFACKCKSIACFGSLRLGHLHKMLKPSNCVEHLFSGAWSFDLTLNLHFRTRHNSACHDKSNDKIFSKRKKKKEEQKTEDRKKEFKKEKTHPIDILHVKHHPTHAMPPF